MAAPLALVTGASTGIGFALAKLAAQAGYDLVVAADEPQIEDAAEKLRAAGAAVVAVETDLATCEGIERTLAAADRPLAVVCANAGTGTGGAFVSQAERDWRHTIDTNVTGTVYLLQRVLRNMIARGEGRVLVTGSIAGYVPGSFNAVYNASKAFIDNFTDALREELRDHPRVTLTTLKPGATDTAFFARAGMLDTRLGRSRAKADPADVAKDGWEAMLAGRGAVTSGWLNKLQVAAAGVAPAAAMARIHRRLAEPGSAG